MSDKMNCKLCGKLMCVNKFETCLACRQVDKRCPCGVTYRGGPKSKACPKCNKECIARHKARKVKSA